MSEFGVVLPLRAVEVRRGAAAAEEALPVIARSAVGNLLAHLHALDERITGYDRELEAAAHSSDAAMHLMTVPGVGPLMALAIVATVGHAHEFANGRQFAAWLGLVPRQWSTGAKPRLGHITKRANPVGFDDAAGRVPGRVTIRDHIRFVGEEAAKGRETGQTGA